ncbi:hypothetical protein [Caminibacter pacificus]
MKIKTAFRKIIDRFFLTSLKKKYIECNRKKWMAPISTDTERVILIDFLHSYPVIETYSYASNYIAKKKKAKIKYYFFERDSLDRLFMPNKSLREIYSSFGATSGFGWSGDFDIKFRSFFKAIKTFVSLNNKNSLLELKIGIVPVGSLIYDTFLRKYKKETVDLESLKVLLLIYESYVIYEKTKLFFTKNSVEAVFAGDVAYIYSGIVARYAILTGKNVYSIVEKPGLLFHRMDESFYRRIPFWKYKEMFSELTESQKREGLIKGAEGLNNRFDGKIDENMGYMRNSSFSSEECDQKIFFSSSSPKIVVMLPDFFDSPHIYRFLLFPDFWEWIVYTLELAQKTSFEWYVKPHPNALPGNEKIVARLKKMFPKIVFLDPRISNRCLLKENVASVFTAYGSVGHEFPYYGIPVVNAGDNPHIAYSFNFHPSTIDEYKNFVLNAGDLKLDIDRREIEEFYYMHYIHFGSKAPLSPVYPPKNFERDLKCKTSKECRTIYHKDEKTLAFLLSQRTSTNEAQIYKYFKEVFEN